MTLAVQLGHGELLFLLGALRLPIPLALGPNPTAGFSAEGLSVTLTTSMSSLLARGYLAQPAPSNPSLMVDPTIESLLLHYTLADRCVVVEANTGHQMQRLHVAPTDDGFVLHTVGVESVHRLERYTSVDDVVELLMGWLGPQADHAAPSTTFHVDEPTLATVLTAIERADSAGVRHTLEQAGVQGVSAARFLTTCSHDLTRLTMTTIFLLPDERSQWETLSVLTGTQQAWLVQAVTGQPNYVEVCTVAAPTLRARLAQQLMDRSR